MNIGLSLLAMAFFSASSLLAMDEDCFVGKRKQSHDYTAITKVVPMKDGVPRKFTIEFDHKATLETINRAFAECVENIRVYVRLYTQLRRPMTILQTTCNKNMAMENLKQNLETEARIFLLNHGYGNASLGKIRIMQLTSWGFSKDVKDMDKVKNVLIGDWLRANEWCNDRLQELHLAVAVLNKNGKKIWW